MSDEEILAFLTRWVMEYGSSTFDWAAPVQNYSKDWYRAQTTVGVKHYPVLHEFFDLGWSNGRSSLSTIKINKTGLGFIARGGNYGR